MAVDYNRLDEVYKEIPEILDLLKAAAWVSQEAFTSLREPTDRLANALASMRKAGMALDKRNH